jgi:hypothetical protein
MTTRNAQSTRYYSNKQEQYISKLLGGKVVPNSGAARFCGGDVKAPDFLIECKTTETPKKSFSIKKDWLGKTEQERKDLQIPYSALAFQFEPDGENFFVLKEQLFRDMYNIFTKYQQ